MGSDPFLSVLTGAANALTLRGHMKIESIDLFYVSMPVVRDIGDGSQDALLVRVRADERGGGGLVGWGESEASPLVSIANFCCPMSHSACKNVRDVVIGRRIETPDDIVALGEEMRAKGLDIAQTDHTFAGVEIALWDLLGKRRGEPVWRLLGYENAYPKTPYASQLFGDTPQETRDKAAASRKAGYRAVKFGWGPYGRGSVQQDRDQVAAAREGLGKDGMLLIDAGTVWVDAVAAAEARLPALEEFGALWLEEPFIGGALDAHRQLASRCKTVKLAGGEGAHNFHMARNLIDHGRIGFVQIDTGRIGGIAPAKKVADYAQARGVTFVNHTFTTHGCLAASLAPFAGIERDVICEYPVEPTIMARELYHDELALRDGQVVALDAPGLGVEPNLDALRRYLIPLRIEVSGNVLYQTPAV
jgi:L-alanine-DL-glutamate epimerase-like enolase superfamily enzyme